MPNLPDVPGKSLVDGVTRHARKAAGAAGNGALTVGGTVLKRALGSRLGEGGDRRDATPSPSHPPSASPVPPPAEVPKLHLKEAAEREAAPAPRPTKPKTPKAKPAKPRAAKPKPAKLPGKPKGAARPKAKPATEPPGPFDKREDPRDPADPDGAPFGK
jgi:hypothetical protein